MLRLRPRRHCWAAARTADRCGGARSCQAWATERLRTCRGAWGPAEPTCSACSATTQLYSCGIRTGHKSTSL
eukprot:5050844-Pyramimonas_sp.AAC.1